MKSLQSYISSRYLKFKKKDRNIALMIKICFLGILIGTFSLMLTLIITNGFEKSIHEKMQGINSQVLIYSPGERIDQEGIKNFLQKKFGDQITGISGNSIRQVLIDKNKNQSVLFLKGIDPVEEAKVTNIAEKIILPVISGEMTGKPASPLALSDSPKSEHREDKGESYRRVRAKSDILQKLLNPNSIIIGHKTAEQFNIKLGDEIKILIPEPTSQKRIYLKKEKVKVTGIFKVGLEEYDNNFAFCSHDYLLKIFDEEPGVDQIALNLKDPSKQITLKDIKNSLPSFPQFFSTLKDYVKQTIKNIFTRTNHEDKIIKQMQNLLPMLTVNSWKDLYPALVSSLKLEKYVMFFILALITLVACMTMISLLFMYIQQKRRDIAILKSMGLADRKIRSIFLRIGLRITFFASVCGLTLAGIAGYFLEQYPFIELPDVYYISYLPARMDPEIFIVVFFATMLLGFLATWIPAKRTKRINIAQVLRQE
jgi:lipoprotein-releasing system permease protein